MIQNKIRAIAMEIGAEVTKIEDAVHAFLAHILHLGKNDQAKAQIAVENAIVKAQDVVDAAATKAVEDVKSV